MDEIGKLTGRPYKPFVYYGDPAAKEIIICMGSIYDTVCETSDYLNANGRKTGVIHVHLYRPFSVERLLDAIPDSVEKIAVLDRTKEPGAFGEPLFLDVAAALAEAGSDITIVGGRYGLGSKDTKPVHIAAVYDLLMEDDPQPRFTIGIHDDVTNLSLPVGDDIQVSPPGTISARFWGLGSDGTVGANKNSIKIIGDHTPMYAQAYFSYDSKKSGGVTISDLRFGNSPIRAPYLVASADFIACTIRRTFICMTCQGAEKGGSFLRTTEARKNSTSSPGQVKRYIAETSISIVPSVLQGDRAQKSH